MQPHRRDPTSSKPSMRALAVGQLLCQYGDPPGPMYVILAGKLLVYRPNPKRPYENIELAQLGPGAVVGEVAPILGQLRSASVRAIEASTLLVVPVNEQGVLGKLQAPVIRVIVQALHERAGLSATEITALAGNWGVELPDLAALFRSSTTQDTSDEPGLTAAQHSASALYSKTVTCPICQTAFPTQIVRLNKDQPLNQESDFHQTYDIAFNPYDYEPWVCPTDLYAALPADFTPLTDSQRELVPAAIEALVARDWGGERPDFSGDRTLALREQALQIALVVCRVRAALPLRTAAVLHRLAWCARERGDTVTEQVWLREALKSYSAAHEQGADVSAKDTLRVEYLCGELALRLGDRAGAYAWFAQGLQHPELKAHPMWARMIRAQLAEARTLETR
jgi:uncharacterized protein (DUF2225 family)